MKVNKLKKVKFGTLSDGSEVHLYTLSNKSMSFSVMDYGCTITSIILNGKNGSKTDICTGYSTLEDYIKCHLYYGAAIGRCANRIGGASFELNGQKYSLDNNDNGNCLHGGFDGWDKLVWNCSVKEDREYADDEEPSVSFTHFSPDGEQGFPGDLEAEISFILRNDNTISITYKAVSKSGSVSTPVNILHHTYFNLKGQNKGCIEDNLLKINGSSYVEVNDKLTPTGKLINVENTIFDFRKPKTIGKDIKATGIGYDHCFCLDNWKSGQLMEAAVLQDPESGRKLTVMTDLPGVQFYSSNFIEGSVGKSGIVYHNHDAVCLETEYYPDSPNQKAFPSCILKAGETWTSVTEYRFEF